MEEIERLVAELSIHSFEVESMHWVEVTHVIDPFKFYVRPNKYKSIIQVFESMEPTIKSTNLNIQDLVIFNWGYSCGARKYIRGRISSITKVENFMECDVFAIDYGFSEKSIPIEYIWECSQALANTPPLAYDCQLANCYPILAEGFPPDSIHAFKYYAGIEPIKMKVLGKKPHKLLVELINSIPESIATLLAISGYSMLGHYYDTIAWNPIIGRKNMYFNFKELRANEKIHVRVQSGSSLNEFYVAEVSDYNKHLKNIDFITFYARREFSLSPVHLIEGTLVCVKIDEKNIYERAFIKKVTKPNENAIVHLVDWGRDEEFPVGKIKYMSPQCLRIPVLSIYCKTEESQVWDNGSDNFLSPGYEFNITIKQLGHQFECPNTVDISPLVEFDKKTNALKDVVSNEDANALKDLESNEETSALKDVESNEEASALEDVESNEEASALIDVESNDEASCLKNVESNDEASFLKGVEYNEDASAFIDVESNEEASAFNYLESNEEASALKNVKSNEEASALIDVEFNDEASFLKEVECNEEASALKYIESNDKASALKYIESNDEASALKEVEFNDEASALKYIESIDEASALKEVEFNDEASALKYIESNDEASALKYIESNDEVSALKEINE